MSFPSHSGLYNNIHLLKKLVQLGCISEGFLCGSHQPKVLIHQTFQQLTAAFISGNGLQSVCVVCVKVTANDEWDKIKLKLDIGKTGRTLTQCLKEHRRAITNGDLATSALAEHAHSTGHPINWTEVHVIATCSHTSRQCLLESWMIHKETNHLNRELSSLPHIYKTLIRHSQIMYPPTNSQQTSI